MNAGSENVWHEGTKNWTLAVKCFEKLLDAMPHLKILVVGRSPPDHLKGRILHVNFIDFHVFLTKIARSKILFVPSYSDASPRVITQALYLNTSVVVNEAIIGGWKYVNNETGAFFTDENDIVEVVRRILASQQQPNPPQPREWFRNFSLTPAKRLESFIEMMRFEYFKGVPNFEEEIVKDLERIQDPADAEWERGITDMDNYIYSDYNEWYGIVPEQNSTNSTNSSTTIESGHEDATVAPPPGKNIVDRFFEGIKQFWPWSHVNDAS